MTPSSLIVVTDRGGLKAYKVNETPTRGPSLQLVQAFNVTDAHGRPGDKVTDLAGRYAASGGSGLQQASIGESHMESETDRRIYKQLADQIVKLVKSDNGEGWSFAAPAEMHSAVVDLLPGPVRDRIVEHVKSDLLKIEPAKLSSHLAAAHAVESYVLGVRGFVLLQHRGGRATASYPERGNANHQHLCREAGLLSQVLPAPDGSLPSG